MIIAISILSTLIILMSIYLIAVTMHIRKIQKELEQLNRVDSMQDSILEQHVLYSRDLALAIRDIQDYLIEQQNLQESKKYVIPFSGPRGEA
jgi:hypothetical protein